jgi:hypothetical protein
MTSTVTKTLLGFGVALSLWACSSAPTAEDTVSSNEALLSKLKCGPCQSNGTKTCYLTVLGETDVMTEQCSSTCPAVLPYCELQPIVSWPAVDSFVSQFGCIDIGTWYNLIPEPKNQLTDNEGYALCPKTAALDAWIANNPAGLGPDSPTPAWMPVHEAAACDACLAAPVAGWTYVFFDNLTGQDITPGCTGSSCNVPRW